MNQARYEQLAGRVLDDEALPAEIAELRKGLRHKPRWLVDLQCNLVIWELWSQECRRERNADSFVSAWRTRLAAETYSEDFVERTLERVEKKSSRHGFFETVRRLMRAAANGIPWTWCAATASLLLAVGFCLCFATPMGDPILGPVSGLGLSLKRAGSLMPAVPGTNLKPGDILVTASNVTAEIVFAPERTRIVLERNSELALEPWDRGKHFTLSVGKINATAARQRPFRPMFVITPQAKVRVVGTKFVLAVSTNTTRLEVIDGRVELTRFSDNSKVVVRAGNYAVASASYDLLAQPLTGSILREYWTNMPGDYFVNILTTHPDFPNHPSGRESLNRFEAPSNWGKDYGTRIYGYLHPPQTGVYTFWISGSSGGLFLSLDENARNKQQIGTAQNSQPHEWTHDSFQQSPPIPLVAGRKYYIEALQKHGRGADHLAVAWQGPGGAREVIGGEFLSPFKAGPEENKR